MSKETATWLNTRTLIGFTDKRGNAWHYRADMQGDEPNHYPGAIPVADLERRLFGWRILEGTVTVTVMTDDGVTTYEAENRVGTVRPRGTFGDDDPGEVLGLFMNGFTTHQYHETLVDPIEMIVDDADGLQVASAGLLKAGAVAWVQVELPDSLETNGVVYRPFLTAATSCDGSLATTYKRGVTAVVCDNTLSANLLEPGEVFRIKHTAHSLPKVLEMRDALGIVYSTGDDFARQVERLTNVEVTDAQWKAFVDAHAPLAIKGKPLEGRSLTMATNKRDTLNRLWYLDPRVAPWNKTAFGVVQAVNTYTHHEQGSRGSSRADRNALRTISGQVDALDQGTLAQLVSVGVQV